MLTRRVISVSCCDMKNQVTNLERTQSTNMNNVKELTVCLLNVKGIGDMLKQRQMFRWLRNKKYSIYFLQEVHGTTKTNKHWANEWGYKAIFSNCSSSRGGVCILFNNTFSFQILRQYSDREGRFIIADIKTKTSKHLCSKPQ